MSEHTTFLTQPVVTQYRDQGIRPRTLTYAWPEAHTETDYVCTRCLTIVVDGVTCPQCQAQRERSAARLQEFLTSRKEQP